MANQKLNRQEMNVLYSEFKKINLVEFIEKETGKKLKKSHDRYSCICPMPFHKDSQPSFNVYKDNSGYFGDCWIYHCFGCGSGGTIIDFCMNYKSLEYPSEAILYLIEKLGMKNLYEIAVRAIKDAKIDIDIKKKLDSEHFLASKRCFRLLKKYNNKKAKEWVYDAYRKMNIMLSKEDLSGIEKVSNKAVKLYNNFT